MDTIIEETSANGERETIDKNNDTAETCSKDNTPEDRTKEPNEDATSCSKDTTPNNGTKEPNEDATSCSMDTTPNNGTKEPNEDATSCNKDATPINRTKEPNEDAMSKDDTETLNVKVDTKLTETLAEAKSDLVENQEGTQDLGFDCNSRVAEKTVNTKGKKKQAKQEKRKHKDDKTDTDPQKMYRGNDQSHNADKRRNRFDREKKGEPGISATKEEFVFFWKSYSPYSQWYISDFTVNGNAFNCAEQYMMYSKAMLFEDKETADAILQELDPRNHKWLGRRVQNFDQKKWDKNCMDIVKRGNKAKFSQDKKLYKTIIDTHPKTLVEASPMDRIWGIGLAADDYRARNRKSWRGKNLLGQALTEVRDELIQEEKSGKHDKRDTASQNISETGTDNNGTQGSTDDRLKDETENTEELKAKTTVPETGDMTGENNPLECCKEDETSQRRTSDTISDLPPSNIDVKSQVSTIKQVKGDETVATDNVEKKTDTNHDKETSESYLS